MAPPSFGSSPTEPTRLRQIALVVKDLDRAEHLLTKVLGIPVIYRDPSVAQWGLRNILLPLSGDIIEVVSPFQPNTTAGRLLDKRGDGGYMIIMQNADGLKSRKRIEAMKDGPKVIFSHGDGEGDTGYQCTQYHPKGIKGGMMPELDSMSPTKEYPRPLQTDISPWGPCGKDFATYSGGMRKAKDLHLSGVLLRLAPGDVDTEGASRQWSEIFGVPTSRDLLAFTNARMGFIRGVQGKSEGLDLITVAVEGNDRLQGILNRAREEGLCGDGWIDMCGVRWIFVDAGTPRGKL